MSIPIAFSGEVNAHIGLEGGTFKLIEPNHDISEAKWTKKGEQKYKKCYDFRVLLCKSGKKTDPKN